jgi:hypothetical protein
MKERLRRCGELTVAGILVIFLGMAQDFRSADWWGSTVTYEQALKMPQWQRGGRFEEVPHRPFDDLLTNNLNRSFKQNGDSMAPTAVQQFYARHPQMSFVGIPFFFALCGLSGAALWRRLRAPQASPFDSDRRNTLPWEWLALFCGAIAGYWLVRIVAFKLFLPSRQLGFSIQFIVVTGLPVLVWLAVKRMRPQSEWLPVVVAAVLTVFPAFFVHGHGLAAQRMGYSDRKNEAKFYKAIHALPLDQEIACDLRQCEVMMALGRHMPYSAKNLSHPLRLGFYAEAERRLVEMNRAFFATDVAELKTFVERENVHYFVYNSNELKGPHKSLYNPVKQMVKKIFQQGRNKPRLLAKPPKESIVYQEGTRLIVDLDKLIAHAPAAAAVEPVEPAEPVAPAEATTPAPTLERDPSTLLRRQNKLDGLKRLPMLKR